MSNAVIAKVREVCQAYLNPNELLLAAQETVEKPGSRAVWKRSPESLAGQDFPGFVSNLGSAAVIVSAVKIDKS